MIAVPFRVPQGRPCCSGCARCGSGRRGSGLCTASLKEIPQRGVLGGASFRTNLFLRSLWYAFLWFLCFFSRCQVIPTSVFQTRPFPGKTTGSFVYLMENHCFKAQRTEIPCFLAMFSPGNRQRNPETPKRTKGWQRPPGMPRGMLLRPSRRGTCGSSAVTGGVC